jgi:hypothetical protein
LDQPVDIDHLRNLSKAEAREIVDAVLALNLFAE